MFFSPCSARRRSPLTTWRRGQAMINMSTWSSWSRAHFQQKSSLSNILPWHFTSAAVYFFWRSHLIFFHFYYPFAWSGQATSQCHVSSGNDFILKFFHLPKCHFPFHHLKPQFFFGESEINSVFHKCVFDKWEIKTWFKGFSDVAKVIVTSTFRHSSEISPDIEKACMYAGLTKIYCHLNF